MENSRQKLENKDFIRSRMFERDRSAFDRYKSLVVGEEASLSKFISYELLITFIGPLPGALGLALRKILFRSLFKQIGRNVIFGRNITIRHPQKIRIGNKVIIDDETVIDGYGSGDEGIEIGDEVIVNRGCQLKAKVGPISIGARSSLGSYSTVVSQGGVIIGEDVNVAGGCFISGGLDRSKQMNDRKLERYTEGPIKIGDRVHLGMGATVLDHVIIGNDSIVQAGSVVMSNLEKDAVALGIPARVWRERTTQSNIEVAPAKAVTDDLSATIKHLRNYLVENFLVESDDELLDDESFLSSEILDSAALVEMVQWLETEFSIRVENEDIVPENFDSLRRIASFLHRKRLK